MFLRFRGGQPGIAAKCRAYKQFNWLRESKQPRSEIFLLVFRALFGQPFADRHRTVNQHLSGGQRRRRLFKQRLAEKDQRRESPAGAANLQPRKSVNPDSITVADPTKPGTVPSSTARVVPRNPSGDNA
jgi:hypothetical protein